MKRRSLTLALYLGMFLCPPDAFGISEGDLMPTYEAKEKLHKLPDLHQDALKGKVTIVNFWATWCEACKIELKEMQEVFADLLKNERFRFAFVSLDKDASKAEEWVKANLKNPDEFSSYLYKDPDFKFAELIGVDAFPMTLVINKDGKVVKIQRGFKEGDGSTEVLAKIAKDLL